MQHAVAGTHSLFLDLGNSFGDQLGIGVLDRLVIVGRINQALATSPVMRLQFFTQGCVCNRAIQVVLADFLNFLNLLRIRVQHTLGKALHIGYISGFALQINQQIAVAAEFGTLLFAESWILDRKNPLCRALKMSHPGTRRQCRDNLHTR